jgi:hypothetical protein
MSKKKKERLSYGSLVTTFVTNQRALLSLLILVLNRCFCINLFDLLVNEDRLLGIVRNIGQGMRLLRK